MRRAIRRRGVRRGRGQRRCVHRRRTGLLVRGPAGSWRRGTGRTRRRHRRCAPRGAPRQIQRRVGAAAAGGRVDFDDLDLVAVLTADADADRDAAGGGLSEARDLPCRHQRMPQRQQVDAQVDVEARLHGCECCQEHRPVEAAAVDEAHVIRREEVIDPGVGDRAEALSLFLRFEIPQVPGRCQAHSQRHGGSLADQSPGWRMVAVPPPQWTPQSGNAAVAWGPGPRSSAG